MSAADRTPLLLELLLPALLVAGYPLLLVVSLTGNLPATAALAAIYLFAMPVAAARLVRRAEPRTGWWDSALAAGLLLLALDLRLWPFGLPAYAWLVLAVPIARRIPRVDIAFIVALAPATALLLMSWVAIAHPAVALALGAATSVAGFAPYFLILGRERWRDRPGLLLALGATHLTVASGLIGFIGASTPYLTELVARQPGAELIHATGQGIVGPRTVVPIPDGLLVHRQHDELNRARGARVERIRSSVELGRIDGLRCDPELPTLCYAPSREAGLVAIDTERKRVEVLELGLPRARYDLLVADAGGERWALISDTGRVVTMLRRDAPARFTVLDTLDQETDMTWSWSHAADWADDGLQLLTRTPDGRIELRTLDPEGGEPWPVFATIEAGYARGRHGLGVTGERVVYATRSGKLFVFDWQGHVLLRQRGLTGIRQLVHDAKRGRCYGVDGLGFLHVIDLAEAREIARPWAGPAAGNLHIEGDGLYVGSATGLWRFDLDAIAEGSTKRTQGTNQSATGRTNTPTWSTDTIRG